MSRTLLIRDMYYDHLVRYYAPGWLLSSSWRLAVEAFDANDDQVAGHCTLHHSRAACRRALAAERKRLRNGEYLVWRACPPGEGPHRWYRLHVEYWPFGSFRGSRKL